MMTNMTKVFVYGTLKKGHHANHLMGDHYLGKAYVEGMRLFDLGGFPCCVESEDLMHSVLGEIYEVNAAQLAQLDRYEGVSSGLFKRILVNPDCFDCDQEHDEVHMYVWGSDTPPQHAKELTGNMAEWRPINAKVQQPVRT
jgi:gamma-glutamylcyclotransferase (GGCT)/AIG2-like uncharacterized protein YtfP